MLSLDTRVFLWALTDDQRLPSVVAETIVDPHVEVFVSAACIWELAIKVRIGRLALPDLGSLADAIAASGFVELPVTAAHAARTAQLELVHRDPFDRILVAQAQHENLTLATVDDAIRRYPGVHVLPA